MNKNNNNSTANANVNVNANVATATPATPTTAKVIVGHNAYDASWVHQADVYVTSAYLVASYMEKYDKMVEEATDEKAKAALSRMPTFKVAVHIKAATSDDVYGLDNDNKVTSHARTLWFSSIDLKAAVLSNPVTNNAYEDIYHKYDFSALVGTRLKVTTIVIPAGSEFMYPYSSEVKVAEKDIVTSIVDNIMCVPYSPYGTQRDMFTNYIVDNNLTYDEAVYMMHDDIEIAPEMAVSLRNHVEAAIASTKRAANIQEFVSTLKMMQDAEVDPQVIAAYIAANPMK